MGRFAASLFVVVAVVLAAASSSPAKARGSATCRGPASLDNYFALTKHRKVTAADTSCATAKRVVEHFAASCHGAYAAQGSCGVRAGRRWRCRSRIVGDLSQGVPSRERCRGRRARVAFVIAHLPPTEPLHFTPSVAAATSSGPYDEGNNCIDLSPTGTVIPPPDVQDEGDFEIHMLGGIPEIFGQNLQARLLAHKVSPTLHAGLASLPRNNPDRVPIFLNPGQFDADNSFGVKAPTCPYPSDDAIVIRNNVTGITRARTGAHELFHAYSAGVQAAHGVAAHPWWEEASATWAESATGFGEDPEYDEDLQFPNQAIDDTAPKTYPYAMARFVEFLEDRGFIGTPAWPLQQQVIGGYGNPGATPALDAAIRQVNPNSSLGEQVAAFWGDRIRDKPPHGPELKPSGPGSNGVKVKPEVTAIEPAAKALHTRAYDFTLTSDVTRVEFEFETPANGYFWAAPTTKESEPFRDGDTESFCVGSSTADDLKWPGHFPVTFTNGNLSGGPIQGKITIRAQKDPGLCSPPVPNNRACELLDQAKAESLLGAGSYPYSNQSEDANSRTWICFYTGDKAEVDLNLAQAKKATARQVRENTKDQINALNLDPLKGVGSIAGIGTRTADGKTYTIVVFAVARENAFFTLAPDDHPRAITLAKRLAGQLD